MDQAYRLYTLALAGSPDYSSMNRFKEVVKWKMAKWRLANAYLLAGQQKAAEDLIQNLDNEVDEYNELGGTFGSSLRDLAMMLETVCLQKDTKNAFVLLKNISERINKRRWLSTHSAAWCLYSASKYAEMVGKTRRNNGINQYKW